MYDTILEALRELNKQTDLNEDFSNFDKLNFTYLFRECIDNISEIYPNYSKYLKDLPDPVFSESINKWGETERQTHIELKIHKVSYSFKLKFSKLLLGKEFKDISTNVIYHEIAHCIAALILMDKYNNNIIKDASIFKNLIEEKGGHGDIWLNVANTLNKFLNLKYPIKVLVSASEAKYMIEQNRLHELLNIRCKNCNTYFVIYKDDFSIEQHIKNNYFLSQFLISFGIKQFHPKGMNKLNDVFQTIIENNFRICPNCNSINTLQLKLTDKVKKYSKHLANQFLKNILRRQKDE